MDAATREAELRARHADPESGCHICFLLVQLDEARALTSDPSEREAVIRRNHWNCPGCVS